MWKERFIVLWTVIAGVEPRQPADAGVCVVLDDFSEGVGAVWYTVSGWRCAVRMCA